MTTVTAKMEQPAAGKHVPILMGKVTAKVEGSGAKIELLAAKIEGERVLSIGCDGAVTDGSATWRLEGPSAFAFPDGTQIHLQPGGKDDEGACASVDITSGNQHVHLRSKGSGVVISKPTKPTLGHKISETGQKMATADGTYFIKLAPSAQPVEGKIAGWAVLENVDGQIRASGIVLKKGDGVTKVDYMKIELKNVLVTSF